MSRRCESCRYWSDQIADLRGESLSAQCLLPGPAPAMKRATEVCVAWGSNHLGAIDEPGRDPLRYQRVEDDWK